MKQGYILIDKPTDWTSHDIVSYIRNMIRRGDSTVTKRFRVGHAGTLDPFASGLLIVGIGREATRQIDVFKDMNKTYVATLELGATSDTYDTEGVIVQTPDSEFILSKSKDSRTPVLDEISAVLKSFEGQQEQLPPMHSAKKVNGKKLYELAREGAEVERKAHNIEIFDIKLLKFCYPQLKIEVSCSKGTYIRSLAHDIGQKLGVGAYCKELRRTQIGQYHVDLAKKPSDLNFKTLQRHIFDLSTHSFGSKLRQFWVRLTNALF